MFILICGGSICLWAVYRKCFFLWAAVKKKFFLIALGESLIQGDGFV